MIMKKLSILLLACLCLFSCTKTDKVKVGVIMPLTGDAAAYGSDVKRGIEFAYDNLSEQDKEEINFIYEDSKAVPKEAVTIFQKLTDIDGCKFIIGPFTSSATLSIAPIAEKKGVIILTPTGTAPAITNAGDYTFRIIPSDEYDGAVMSEYAFKKLNKKTFTVIYSNNDYGVGIEKAFVNHSKKIGAEVIESFSFKDGETNFKTILEQNKKLNPDAIFIVGSKEMGYILRQAKEMGITSQFISTGMLENKEIIEIAKNSANDVYYSYPSYNTDEATGNILDFINKFESKYGHKPSVLEALGYDAANIVFKAIKEAKNKDYKSAMYKIQNYDGVSGTMSFDANGDVIKSIGIKKISNGEFVWIENQFNIQK